MTPEELKKILENAETSLEDKMQAIMDAHEADKKGLALKNQELIGAEKKNKDAQTAAEAKLAETTAKVAELEAEMKKNNPEDRQKFYDAKLQELEAKHRTDLEGITSERDKYRAAHVARVRDEAIATGIKDLKLIPAYKDAYIARVLSLNNFKMVEIDGNSVFVNDTNKTIDAVMREFAHSAEGKNFIENASSGGGASGGNPGQAGAGSGAGGSQTVTRQQFEAMAPAAQMDFTQKGGKVVNAS